MRYDILKFVVLPYTFFGIAPEGATFASSIENVWKTQFLQCTSYLMTYTYYPKFGEITLHINQINIENCRLLGATV